MNYSERNDRRWLKAFAAAAAVSGIGLSTSHVFLGEFGRAGFLSTVVATCATLLLVSNRAIRSQGRLSYYYAVLALAPLGASLTIAATELTLLAVAGSSSPIAFVGAILSGIWALPISIACGILYAICDPFGKTAGNVYLLCDKCGYRIDNLPGSNCPECGNRIWAEADNWTPKNMFANESTNADPADWLKAMGFPSVEQLLILRPASVAAVTRTSETFRVDSDLAPEHGVVDHIYVKRYVNHRKTRLRGIFRGTFFGKSRVRLELEHLNNMRRRGVPVVRPITCIENRRWRFVHSSALITEGKASAGPLDAYYVDHRSQWDRLKRRRFVRAMGLSIANMHAVGVLHGRLVWRNILVNECEGDWTFTFLDPGRHCRCYRGHAPRRAVVSDLSDFAASGMAVEWGTDFIRFLRAYCSERYTRTERKSLADRVVRLARPKSSQETHRIAVSSAMASLQRCIASVAAGATPVRFESAEAFCEAITGAKLPGAPRTTWVVQINCTQNESNDTENSCTLVMAPGGVSIDQGRDERPHLTIESDTEAWLTIVNAQPEALDVIRDGRVKLVGDTRPFTMLVRWLETRSDIRSNYERA